MPFGDLGVISLALVAIVAGAIYLLYPLAPDRRKNNQEELSLAISSESSGLRKELILVREERDRIYGNLLEVDHDFKAGDLNREDFLQLHAEYNKQALATLLKLDGLEARERQAGEEIEQAVAKILARAQISKKARGVGAGKGPGIPTVAARGNVGNTTPQTAAPGRSDREELPGLNRAGPEGEEEPLRLGRFCPRCRHETKLSDLFCSRCGLKLSRFKD